MQSILEPHFADRVRFVRNRTNIGGGANQLRCMLECETEWMWLVGDDDPALPEAIATIQSTIAAHPDATYINFACLVFDYGYDRDVVCRGLESFVRQLTCGPNLLFIPTGVYNVKRLGDAVRWGHHFTYSQAVHVAVILKALGADGVAVLSPRPLLDLEALAREAPLEAWPRIYLNMCIGVLLDVEMSRAARMRLASLIGGMIVTPFRTFVTLLHEQRVQELGHNALYRFDQITHRLYRYTNPWFAHLAAPLLRLALMVPALGAVTHFLYSKLRRGGKGNRRPFVSTADGENRV